MRVLLKNITLVKHLEEQAELQNTTPDELVEKILVMCQDLKLIEKTNSDPDSETWGFGPRR